MLTLGENVDWKEAWRNRKRSKSGRWYVSVATVIFRLNGVA